MAADALVSAGVIIAGLFYLWKEWSWLDPVVSLIIAGVVIIGTWSLFKRSLHLLFDGVPDDIDLPAVSQSLMALPGVNALHDLHIWALSTTETALTAHLVVDDDCDSSLLLCQAEKMLHDSYDLHHVTLQIETGTYADNCHSGQCGITQ
jgi:cobalt-zinc-cadmium efflux system protein